MNSHSDNSDIRDNEFANESINLVGDTPTKINESNIGNNQRQCPEYKTLKEKLKPIFLETIDNFNDKNVDGRIHPSKVYNKKIGQLTVIIKCKQTNTYSKHQKSPKVNFEKSLEIRECLIYNQKFIL